MTSFSDSLSELSLKLDAFMETSEDERAEYQYQDEEEAHRRKLIDILEQLSTIVHQAEDTPAPDLAQIVDRVDELFSRAIAFCYGGSEADSIYQCMPSFAHVDTSSLINDEREKGVVASGLLDAVMPLLKEFMDERQDGGVALPKKPKPWSETYRPHVLTNPHARFRDSAESTTFSGTSSTPLANVLLEGRFECSSDAITLPIQLSISTSGKCVAVPTMGGYKNRTPVLMYYLPNHDISGFPDSHCLEVGLSDIAYHSVTDEERKLIFVGDASRVKSYAWGKKNKDENYDTPLATHTLQSKSFTGPIAVLPGGRLIRAGKGSVGVWNIDTLATHGPKGKTVIGKKIKKEDTMRDDEDEIEWSSGSEKDAVVPLMDLNFVMASWQLHPNLNGVMLCGSDPDTTDNYSCLAFDLEHGGSIVTRYLGNGGSISRFSTSGGDRNVFATACNDGYARLFDVRRPLPVLTIDSSQRVLGCPGVALAHPDGIPLIFTGGQTMEQVMMWDIRARRIVYDMATGNNAVNDLAWDADSSTLWVTTECPYVDRMGGHHGYRRPRILKVKKEPQTGGTPMDQDDEKDYRGDEGSEENEYEDDDEMEEGQNWPAHAHHGENYYGHTFDASEHSIFRYRYREEPDLDVIPTWGYAELEGHHSMW